MPWHAAKGHGCPDDRPWAVVKNDTGEKVACHASEADAQKQVAALYANVPEARRDMSDRADTPAKPYGDVQYADPGYQKDKKKRYPIDTEAHVRAAWSYINQSDNASQYTSEQLASIKARIKAAAKRFGIEISDDGGRSVMSDPLERQFTFTLERGESDGRTLEGYVAVFDSPTHIRDQFGEYDEVVQRGAFQKTLSERQPKLLFNHGRHPLVGDMPIGSIEVLREDARGLYIRAPLFDNWMVDPLVDAMRSDPPAVDGMSFRFEIPEGKHVWKRENGSRTHIVREAKLHDVGPVVFPAYKDAKAMLRSLGELDGVTVTIEETDDVQERQHETPEPQNFATQDPNGDGACDHCGFPNGDHKSARSARSEEISDTPDEAAEGTSDVGAVEETNEGEDVRIVSSTERDMVLIRLGIR